MTQERLVGLIVLNVHRDIVVIAEVITIEYFTKSGNVNLICFIHCYNPIID